MNHLSHKKNRAPPEAIPVHGLAMDLLWTCYGRVMDVRCYKIKINLNKISHLSLLTTLCLLVPFLLSIHILLTFLFH